MSKIAQRVASRHLAQARFELEGRTFEELWEAAQEAEFLHAADDRPHVVKGLIDDPHGMFQAGEIVYTSKGAPE